MADELLLDDLDDFVVDKIVLRAVCWSQI